MASDTRGGVQELHVQYSCILSKTMDKGFLHRETHHLPMLTLYLWHLAVGELLTTVNKMMTRLDDIGQRIGNAPSEDNHVLMDIREVSAFV